MDTEQRDYMKGLTHAEQLSEKHSLLACWQNCYYYEKSRRNHLGEPLTADYIQGYTDYLIHKRA